MTKRILISPNSFKECADSVTIAELIEENLSSLKEAELIIKPISDGGDGFIQVCKYYFGGEIRKYSISTAYDETKFDCPILYIESRKEVYIESADVLGLKAVPVSFRNPLKLSSFGLGELLLKIESDIQEKKISVKKVYIGIGGTATIDMGIGMMAELGLKLLDFRGEELHVIPENFNLTNNFHYKPVKLSFKVLPVVDVTNPLFGAMGGIRVFGKQKGALEQTISFLEDSFNHLLKLFENNSLEIPFNSLSGAGGGIPAVFQIFYNSSPILSEEFIKGYLGVEKYKANVDYLITGEGAYDPQSNSGKGVKTLLEIFKSDSMQVFLICGKISGSSFKNLPQNVFPIELRKYFKNDKESIVNYKEGIEKACREVISQINF